MSKRYLIAMGALYGKDLPQPTPKGRGRKKVSPLASIPLESEEQKVVVSWLKMHGYLVAKIHNEGKRKISVYQWLMGQGLAPGFPDLIVPEPRTVVGQFYAGVFIEMKRRARFELRDNQKWWRDELVKRGYYHITGCGADDAIKKLEWYFKQ